MEQNWLDIQHRGYLAYRRETGETDACKGLNRAIACTDKTCESMDTVLLDCKIKTDWIEHIEAALPFIENAVYENRQFILRQGEMVPIEKAKRVSKTSVEHLSRHSQLITALPRPGEELIPDKIYMVENVGTYAVYENRFLYMLLCYLRDFIGFRYKKIIELADSFSADIIFNREFADDRRKISYSLKYSETSQRLDGVCNSETALSIARIRSILQEAELLLKSPLMQEVSAAPILKPPITKTNILLHNPNFSAAYELYAFLAAYAEDGYEKIECCQNTGAFSESMREDFAPLVAMTSYLSYRCGGLYEVLEERFLSEEKRRKDEEEREIKKRLSDLKEKLGKSGNAVFDYILALEQRNEELENRADQFRQTEALHTEMEGRLEAVAAQNALLQADTNRLTDALLEKEEELQRINESYAQTLQDAQKQLQQAKTVQEETEQRFAGEFERQKQEFLQEYEALAEKYRLANARYHALAEQQGLYTAEEDFSTREAFAELEVEYAAFKRFFERQWKLARKQIRKEQLWRSK